MILVATGFTGCHESRENIHNEIELEVSRFSLVSEADAQATENRCREVCRIIGSLDKHGQGIALETCAKKFLSIPLDETSYEQKLVSIDRYTSLVHKTYDMLAVSVDLPDSLWRFKLKALRRFNNELENGIIRIKAQTNEQVSRGNLMTKRWCRELLRKRRFRAIREGFETGAFPTYYNSLPDNAKSDWLALIKEVAGRDVVIYDPKMPFALQPHHEPLDEREWIPSSDSSKPREYIEHLEDGRTIKMREVRK